MQRNTLFSILATAALGIVVAGPVNAETYRWKGVGSDDYHTDTNWNPTGVPGTGDKANITPLQTPQNYMNPVLDDQDRLLGELEIGSGYTLTVTGVKLTLEDNSHTFTGNLILSNSTSKVEFTFAKASGWVALTGSGGIEGKHASAEVRLNDSKIDNDSVIHGKMTVKEVGGTASFKNDTTGKVLANVAGTLRFEDLDLSGAGVWKAETNPSAILEFATEDLTGLSGDFTLSHDATLKFLASITTSGSFTTNPRCGLVDVDTNANVCFKATGSSDELCNNQTFTTGCPP